MNSYNLAVVIGPNIFAQTAKESESVQLNLSITKVGYTVLFILSDFVSTAYLCRL